MKNPFSKVKSWLCERQDTQMEEAAKEAVYFDSVLLLDDKDGHPYTKMYIAINGVHILEIMSDDEFATGSLQVDNKEAAKVLQLYRGRYIENEKKSGRGARA